MASFDSDPSNQMRLWYRTPARDWMQESLPLGNGSLGVMVFGGTACEEYQFTDSTLWNGGPHGPEGFRTGIRPGAAEALKEVRRLLREGRIKEAESLGEEHLTGLEPDFGCSQAFGRVLVEMADIPEEIPLNYRRELDLETACSSVRFETGERRMDRLAFCSHPAGLFVGRIEIHGPPADFLIRLESDHIGTLHDARGNDLCFSRCGTWPSRNFSRPTHLSTAFEARLRILTDGETSFSDTDCRIRGATRMVLLLGTATNYAPDAEDFLRKDWQSGLLSRLNTAESLGFERLQEDHVADHARLFGRVSLRLEGPRQEELPTDERLAAEKPDVGLIEQAFQFGRYLLIASSRPGGLPAHLQGIWNNSNTPPWDGDYHLNINAQMNYWPAGPANLSECAEPFVALIERLSRAGRRPARDIFGADGWCMFHRTDAWSSACPGRSLRWGWFPGSTGWLCRHLWEHYQFTDDRKFLAHRAMPVLLDAARFYLTTLVEEGDQLIVSPATSPENFHNLPDGSQACISAGSEMEHAIARDLFRICLCAAEELEMEGDLVEAIRNALPRIPEPRIGRYGQIQEWPTDVDNPNDQHRHLSHLYALYPGVEITNSPMGRAAQQSLLMRGPGGTGWTRAWKLLLWARLRDGARAEEMLAKCQHLVRSNDIDYEDGGGRYANMLCAMPPFQIDGNFGFTAGVAELLLQSHADLLDLLPALPESWQSGKVRGLRARGNFLVDLQWQAGQLVRAKISNPGNRAFRVRCPSRFVASQPNQAPLSSPLMKNGLWTAMVPAGSAWLLITR